MPPVCKHSTIATRRACEDFDEELYFSFGDPISILTKQDLIGDPPRETIASLDA